LQDRSKALLLCYTMMEALHSGPALCPINEVTLRRARLVPEWVRYVMSVAR